MILLNLRCSLFFRDQNSLFFRIDSLSQFVMNLSLTHDKYSLYLLDLSGSLEIVMQPYPLILNFLIDRIFVHWDPYPAQHWILQKWN